MVNKLLKIGICALGGLGLGLIVSKYKVEQLEAERDALDLRNKCLESEREIMQMTNDNLRETNKLFSNLLLQEKEDEGT